ncbi:GntR family transcriptional regulator [Actinoplanes sp. CA-131856]
MISTSRVIAETLAEEFSALPSGVKVATEAEIARRFRVGRAAARAALQELERRSLVRRVRGAGTFTARRLDYLISPDHPPSWSATVRASGAIPRTAVLACDVVAMPATVATRLHRAAGDRCFLLRRRSYTNDMPASWGNEWVPADLVPELPAALRVEESLDHILRVMAQVTPQRAWTRGLLESSSVEVASALGTHPGDPAWRVENVNRDAVDGRPLMFTERWIRADTVRVVFEVGAL